MTLNRYKAASKTPLPEGKAKIEGDVKYNSPQRDALVAGN